jgi:hypothetical protein
VIPVELNSVAIRLLRHETLPGATFGRKRKKKNEKAGISFTPTLVKYT